MTGGGLWIGEEDVMSGGGAEVGIHGGVTIMSLCLCTNYICESRKAQNKSKEILKDRELMASIQRGKEDIAKGRVRPWTSVKATSSL